ncbi:DUF2789 domain-containing protein [Roseateles puraquae]|jgi:hypothetical protein|uniref:DUF2789 domain-containing protein n=1 Tax=Roseateles puraquae TaxID=431059 RepID=A0A254N7S4_9BURK|nr:DUF2789 domain-containing protein [Roseateles puraquae]MDG0855857.1 DUF2789 domain-containing protein [Roseateles puraquae]OWQ99906.1 hypothetical protein CDO81_25755 [Roseateles puraquae]
MEKPFHRLSELFSQLGLPADLASISGFIERHSPLAAGTRLEDAGFWTAAQAQLLRDLIAQDADWAEVADQLNSALHRR